MDGLAHSGDPAARFAGTRRIVLTTVVVALTLAGHSAAEGALPSAWGLALAVLIAAALTLIAIAKTRSWAWLFAFLLGSQVLLHAILVVTAGHSHATGGSSLLVLTGWMAIAHVVVAALAAAVLAFGEMTVSAWARLLSATLGMRFAGLGPVNERTIVHSLRTRWFTITSDLAWDATRRGPPRCTRA